MRAICNQNKFRKKLQAYLRLYLNSIPAIRDASLITETIKSLNEGHCFGFSILELTYKQIGSEQWYHDMLRAIINWDGTQQALNQFVYLGERKERHKLSDVFEMMCHYLVSHQSPKLFSDSLYQAKLLAEDIGELQAVTKASVRKDLKNVFSLKYLAADESMLVKFLEVLKEILPNETACEMITRRHAVGLYFRNNEFIFYDSNHCVVNPTYKGADTSLLAKAIIKALYNGYVHSVLAFHFLSFNGPLRFQEYLGCLDDTYSLAYGIINNQASTRTREFIFPTALVKLWQEQLVYQMATVVLWRPYKAELTYAQLKKRFANFNMLPNSLRLSSLKKLKTRLIEDSKSHCRDIKTMRIALWAGIILQRDYSVMKEDELLLTFGNMIKYLNDNYFWREATDSILEFVKETSDISDVVLAWLDKNIAALHGATYEPIVFGVSVIEKAITVLSRLCIIRNRSKVLAEKFEDIIVDKFLSEFKADGCQSESKDYASPYRLYIANLRPELQNKLRGEVQTAILHALSTYIWISNHDKVKLICKTVRAMPYSISQHVTEVLRGRLSLGCFSSKEQNAKKALFELTGEAEFSKAYRAETAAEVGSGSTKKPRLYRTHGIHYAIRLPGHPLGGLFALGIDYHTTVNPRRGFKYR